LKPCTDCMRLSYKPKQQKSKLGKNSPAKHDLPHASFAAYSCRLDVNVCPRPVKTDSAKGTVNDKNGHAITTHPSKYGPNKKVSAKSMRRSHLKWHFSQNSTSSANFLKTLLDNILYIIKS